MNPAGRWVVYSVLSFVLAACASASPVVLESERAPGGSASTHPTSTSTVHGPEPTVLGTVITQTTTSTTLPVTTTTLPPIPEIEGPPAPGFTLEVSDGSTFVLAEQRRPVLLVFWAEWCPSCKAELPVIDQIAADYGNRIKVVIIARESSEDVVAGLVSDLMPSGLVPWGLDDDLEISALYGLPGVPVTVLILGDVEAQRWLGPASDEDLRLALDEYLALMEG